MTTALTLKSAKGSALTESEVDGNFVNLRTTADTAATNITTLQGNVTTLQGQMTTAQSDITGIQAELDALSPGSVADGAVTTAKLANNAVTTTKVGDGAISYVKMQNVSASSRVLGRATSGAGIIEELTISQVLDFVTSAGHGDMLFRGNTGWSRLAAGVSGQFLQTNGAGSNPAWAAPGSVTAAEAFRNKIINNSFEINQYGLTSAADGAYIVDGWYVLTETGSVSGTQVSHPEVGSPWGYKITQPDVSGKRFGLATVLEAKNVQMLRSSAVNFFARVKPSFAGNVRYAILEHTGTADTVTRDVVNNWSSTTFTPSNFFIAGVNVIKTGTFAPGANNYGEFSDYGVLNSNTNNIILFIWSESAQAQNATIEINRPQLEPGSTHTNHEWRANELNLCQRYYYTENVFQSGSLGFFNTYFGGINAVRPSSVLGVTMRVTPSVSITNNANIEYYSYASAYTSATLVASPNSPNSVYVSCPSDGDGRGKLMRNSAGLTPVMICKAEL